MASGANSRAPVLLAAGGVLWRSAASPGGLHADPTGGIWPGDVEVALVHRPRYDDWSLPKGKLERGEHPLVAACREMFEETGVDAVCGRPLGRQEYVVPGRDGEPVDKLVRYWAMTVRPGVTPPAFAPNDEVDELRWVPPATAAAMLTWPRDADPLRRLFSGPLLTTTVLVVRHAHAGDKKSWRSDDLLRPLDGAGRRQAEAVARVAPCFAPVRVLSAEPTRCVETVRPLADLIGVPVEVETAFGEVGYAKVPDEAVGLLRKLATDAGTSVVCSQGGTIPDLLSAVAAADGRSVSRPGGKVPARKGSVWALSFADGRLVDAEYFADLA